MKCIGYCPQFDACFDLLTVNEHLDYYAAVHGIALAERQALIDSLLHLFNLQPYVHATSRSLSGGNRRKLSVAIALLGAPQVVCLDEPSAGMDPIARRLL
uniref:ABC transporter A family member 1 n=1 Tax=Lygus hesperus TaxID=30085 RepID=A0A0A9WPV2_LYGHE